MYLLDTNICIFIMNKKPMHVLARLEKAIDQGIYISSISVAELHYGVYNSRSMDRKK